MLLLPIHPVLRVRHPEKEVKKTGEIVLLRARGRRRSLQVEPVDGLGRTRYCYHHHHRGVVGPRVAGGKNDQFGLLKACPRNSGIAYLC